MKDFDSWLAKTVIECGGLTAACLDLKSISLQSELIANGKTYQNWINSGYAGDMNYLERMLEDKVDPEKSFPGSESVIIITFKNKWGLLEAEHPFPKPHPDKLKAYISAYAKEQDYHRTGHQILTKLHQKLQERLGQFDAMPAVDTKPVFERLLAVLGGLGVRGPNDLLRTPGDNVRAFIGSIFCNIKLPEIIHDPQMPYPCKHCNNCVEKCPTGAIQLNQPFDSLKCISYLTIEKKARSTKAKGK
jgi:epoxyqueuosine reductase